MTDTEQTPSVLERILGWLRAGYPDGVPPKDHFAVLALLKRSLTEEEIVAAARAVLKSNTDEIVTEDEIRTAIEQIIDKEPVPEEVNQVAARLASVGWPLAIGPTR